MVDKNAFDFTLCVARRATAGLTTVTTCTDSCAICSWSVCVALQASKSLKMF
jgi:hypothetical protein